MTGRLSAGPTRGALAALLKWLDSQHVPAVVIGGVAAGILGRPRVTEDVDMLVDVDEERWGSFLASAEEAGFVPRVPEAARFARHSRMFLLRHVKTGTPVDLQLADLGFQKKMIANGKRLDCEGLSMTVVGPEDLVVMKAIAGRDWDMGDIRAVLDANPDMNIAKACREVRELAKMMDASDIAERLDALVASQKCRRRAARAKSKRK